MMRALHLVKTSEGAAWAVRQVRELVALGVDVHVALPGEGSMCPAYRAAGATVHSVPPLGGGLRCLRASAKSISALVSATNPNVIHSHFVITTLAMRMAETARIPRLFQVPGPLHLETPLSRQVDLLTAGAADYWIGSCERTCAAYRACGIEASRVFLSYYGTDIDRLSTMGGGSLRHELRIADDRPIVGMVAFMYAPKRLLGHRRGLKGHEDLIDALCLLPRGLGAVGVFVGGAWGGAVEYERAVKRYATQRRAPAIFLGTRSDVPILYPDFTVAVHPSHSENLGGAGESLLHGIPTIATNVGGFPDLVKPGRTGWLVRPKSPDELAGAIVQVLSDLPLARAMASAGQAAARRLLDVRVTAREVLGIYRLILEGRTTS